MMNKASKLALKVMCATWYVIFSVFASAYIKINYITPDYRLAYWIAVFIYGIGVYVAIAAYCIKSIE